MGEQASQELIGRKLRSNFETAKRREHRLIEKTLSVPPPGLTDAQHRYRERAAGHRQKALQLIAEGKATTIQHARDMVAAEAKAEHERLTLDEKTRLFRSTTYSANQNKAINEYLAGVRSYYSELKLDFDKFSWFNDLISDKFGDLVLSEVGRQFAAVKRANDIGVRKGGEELHFFFNYGAQTQAELAAQRLMSAVRDNVLSQVINIIRDGQRTVPVTWDGRKVPEREGTVILRDITGALLERAKPGGLDRFLQTGKGEITQKLEIARKFDGFFGGKQAYGELESYARDGRPSELLTPDERQARSVAEKKISDFLSGLFGSVTSSGGMVIYGPEDRAFMPPGETVTTVLGEHVKRSKSEGRGFLSVQVGTRGPIRTYQVK
ncbi:hypothetical protein A2Z33_04970 [Candidatus Gottesmanbacteria bacterium RBG_16_52_11]|uniref:GGDEF domain-containing protein n=1 Tax=Candidatus Gottesmanbacteria bacterium RBG_16_52_11 TaxID=1798374 RepID=A0A1F5YQW1_9BACT|nr:MAG: hypothetical protein A2Z33_04970 [Candidatus Gottesmanbacteria bacterium RBG_16_52_11]